MKEDKVMSRIVFEGFNQPEHVIRECVCRHSGHVSFAADYQKLSHIMKLAGAGETIKTSVRNKQRLQMQNRLALLGRF